METGRRTHPSAGRGHAVSFSRGRRRHQRIRRQRPRVVPEGAMDPPARGRAHAAICRAGKTPPAGAAQICRRSQTRRSAPCGHASRAPQDRFFPLGRGPAWRRRPGARRLRAVPPRGQTRTGAGRARRRGQNSGTGRPGHQREIPRRPSVQQHERGEGQRLFHRRHPGGHPHQPRAHLGAARRVAHLGHAVSQHDEDQPADRPGTGRHLPARGQRAAGRQQSARDRPAHPRRHRRACLGQGLRSRDQRHFRHSGRARHRDRRGA